jgi:hypothetical protein
VPFNHGDLSQRLVAETNGTVDQTCPDVPMVQWADVENSQGKRRFVPRERFVDGEDHSIVVALMRSTVLNVIPNRTRTPAN